METNTNMQIRDLALTRIPNPSTKAVKTSLLTVTLVTAVLLQPRGAPSDVDPTFDPGSGANGEVGAIAVQSDGKVLIGGQFTTVNGVPRNGVARLNADGSLDSDFMSGLSGPDSYVDGLALRSDGKVLIEGPFTAVNGSTRTGVALLNADGTLDNSFVPHLSVRAGLAVRRFCLQGDDKVLVAGDFTAVDGVPRTKLARLNANGSLDNSFPGVLIGTNDWIEAIAVQADGKVLIGGSFTSINGVSRANLTRLNPGGTLDTSFLAGLDGPNGFVDRVAIEADGRILVAGTFTLFNGLARPNLTLLNADGSVDPALTYVAPDSVDVVKALVVQPDGMILLAAIVGVGPTEVFNRLNPDGSLDSAFVVDFKPADFLWSPAPDAIALQADGKILIGGIFTAVNQTPSGRVARLMGAYLALALHSGPLTQTAYVGSTVAFSANADGDPPPEYLWFANSTNLLGSSTNGNWKLGSVQFSHAGTYTVVITNVCGSITSAPALLNVIEAVEQRPVPGVKLMGDSGSPLNVDYANALGGAPTWLPLGSTTLASTSQYYFDLSDPLPPQRFYRAWQTGAPGVVPSLDPHMVPAITLTGSIGSSVRVEAINQFGSTNAWFTLDTVTLTNTSQLYFDTSAWRQAQRLYRLVPFP